MFESDAGYVPETPSFGIFFLLKAGADPEDWSRLWTGEHDFDLPPDETDTAGGRYISVGFPTDLPAFSEAFNGSYVSLALSLSGVDATALRLSGADRDEVDGAAVHLGLIDFDQYAQPIGACDWLFKGTAGLPRASREGSGAGAVCTITLPVIGGMTRRNNAQFQFCSPVSQRIRSSTDAFFDRTPSYNAGTTVTWPT